MPYLVIKKADRFFEFMEAVFNAKQKMEKKHPKTGKIQHAELIVNSYCIMYAEATKEWPVQNAGIFLYVPDAINCFQRALEHGAKILQPLTDKIYGRTAGVIDPFGNTWWISTPKSAEQT